MSMKTSTQCPQPTTAGATSKFADFSVVSFPQLKRRSIVKASLMNIDLLSAPDSQSGNIKLMENEKIIDY